MKKGFTLIEIIVSIALICILVLAITGLGTMSIRMTKEAKTRDELFSIARSICEIYKSDSSLYTNPGSEISIYKYIDSISEVQNISDLVINKDGDYDESSYYQIISGNNTFRYTLILNIKRISGAVGMEVLRIEALRKDGSISKIILTAAK